MFDPATLGEMLCEFFLRGRNDVEVCVEYDGPGRRGAQRNWNPGGNRQAGRPAETPAGHRRAVRPL